MASPIANSPEAPGRETLPGLLTIAIKHSAGYASRRMKLRALVASIRAHHGNTVRVLVASERVQSLRGMGAEHVPLPPGARGLAAGRNVLVRAVRTPFVAIMDDDACLIDHFVLDDIVDPSTGRTFYIDHATKRTTWERPTSGARGGGGGYGATPPSQPSRPTPPRAAQQPSGGSQLKSDAELARELAAQWDAEDEAAAEAPAARSRGGGAAEAAGGGGGGKKGAAGKQTEGWAKDDEVPQCFLTGNLLGTF